MSLHLACITGEEFYRQWDAGQVRGEALAPRNTPFGPSGELFRIDTEGASFHVLPRSRGGMEKLAPHRINARANLYALKDLGTDCVLGWGPGGAITHNIAVGDLVVLSDLLDLTRLREETYFEDSPLGELRQFPVFCEHLRRHIADVLMDMKLLYHSTGTAAVLEGPRHETPAEIRMLSTMGAEVVTHSFVPEMFLARELEMGYAAVCYVLNYAETGSRHRPFVSGDLFGGLTQQTDADRLAGAMGALGRIAAGLANRLAEGGTEHCDCLRSQRHNIDQHNLPEDWREWFEHR